MAAEQFAIEEQIRTESKRESLRERIARHLAGDALPSNFEAMCAVLARDPDAGPEPCGDCGGDGFRDLPGHVRAEYQARIDAKLDECSLLLEALKDLGPDALDGSYERRKLETRLTDTERNVRDLRRELNRRGVCRACRGSGSAPRRRRDEDAIRPDGLFTTIPCPACRGRDRRQHPRLMQHHRGTSTGTITPVDDEAAERHDTCPKCADQESVRDFGRGRGYLVPVTVRPTLKTSNVLEDPNGVDDFREGFPAGDFEDASDALEGDGVAEFLERTRQRSPELAAALAAYLGPQGDEWAGHAWGRRFALWPITEPGRRLADLSREPATRDGYDVTLARCAAQRLDELQGERGNPLRRTYMARADAAARSLENRIDQALREADRV